MNAAQLKAIADTLANKVGQPLTVAVSEAGQWKRIAEAAEALAGASTTANPTTAGYMLRAALALESRSGTSGAEENLNSAGIIKRIVDALEVKAGAVTTGSLGSRAVIAATNAVFLGPNLVIDPGLDAPASWTVLPGVAVTGGVLAFDGVTSQGNGAALGTPAVSSGIIAGRTYRVDYTIVADTGAQVSPGLGGAVGAARTAAGTYADFITATTTAAAHIRARFATGVRTGSIDNVSVRLT